MKDSRQRWAHSGGTGLVLWGFLGMGVAVAQEAGVERTQLNFESLDGTRSAQVELYLEGLVDHSISLELGFRTAELPTAGEFHDSLAVTLYRVDAPGSTPLAVSDVFGLLALPNVPGALAIPAGALTIASVPPRGPVVEGETVAIAYEIRVSLPPVYRDRRLGLTISFFDSGDGLASAGYVRTSIVPEPANACLLAIGGMTGLGGLWLVRRRTPGEGRGV